MSARRRRRDRRDRRPDHPEPPRSRPATKKAEAVRRADFESRQARLRRFRTIVGLLGFVPLAAQLICGAGLTPDGPCAVPREIYLALWAAIFGTFLGLTFRLWREKRAFERAGTAPT